jgi:hypothetical protein
MLGRRWGWSSGVCTTFGEGAGVRPDAGPEVRRDARILAIEDDVADLLHERTRTPVA